MNKNTGRRIATTFNLPSAMHESWDAEGVAELMKPYVWSAVQQAENTIDRMINVNGFAYVRYEVPGLDVFAIVDRFGHVQTIIVIEDTMISKLHKAVRKEQPATVSYVKADGEETVRTIEPRSLKVTKSGDVIVKAVDRKSGEHRTFRTDRVTAYTVHRTRFIVRTEKPAPAKTELVAAFRATAKPVRYVRPVPLHEAFAN